MVDLDNLPERPLPNGMDSKHPPADITSHSLQQHFNSFLPLNHQHHDSTSTSASESADSSPTTTASVIDESDATEMSPGSSPESPMAKSSNPTLQFAHMRSRMSEDLRSAPQTTPFFELQRPSTPGKKARNLKNLAVNTTGALSSPRAASTTSLPVTEISLPVPQQSATAFAKPPSPPKRRPRKLGLTITTNANGKAVTPLQQIAIPPTPSFYQSTTLRHFQSSPSLPILNHPFSRSTAPSSIAMEQHAPLAAFSPQSALPDSDEPNFDIPQSREEKPEAYPDGPICVYDPHVHLYLEPSAMQARKYDVILNVASEVKNPFLANSTPTSPSPSLRLDGGGGIQYAHRKSLPSLSNEEATVLSPVQETSSPTTPKATPLRDAFLPGISDQEVNPEYIHIPWEHNTDIVPDLLRLVKLIDDRIRAGKRILVHCQCGVSRSATLVVAFCMYKNPEMSVQEAYDMIKRRSKWIGPNMNLIMQLQEFRSSLLRNSHRTLGNGKRSLTPIEASRSWNEWRRPSLRSSNRAESRTPKTAPLLSVPPTALQTPNLGPFMSVVPGPSSAPSGLAWPVSRKSSAEAKPNLDSPPQIDPQLIPTIRSEVRSSIDTVVEKKEKHKPRMLKLNDSNHGSHHYSEPILSTQTPSDLAMAPLQPPAEVAPEDHFGLMSPSASEFQHSPLDRTALLGSLGMGSAFQSNGSSLSRPKESLAPIRSVQAVRDPAPPRTVTLSAQESGFDALMSPRAFEFTQNPFAGPVSEITPTPMTKPGVSEDDPRSPAQKGASPIIRNIFDAL